MPTPISRIELIGITKMLIERRPLWRPARPPAYASPAQHIDSRSELVVPDHDLIGFDTQPALALTDCLTRVVHIGEWDRERHSFAAADAHLVSAGSTPRAPQLPAMSAREQLDHLGADVLTRRAYSSPGLPSPTTKRSTGTGTRTLRGRRLGRRGRPSAISTLRRLRLRHLRPPPRPGGRRSARRGRLRSGAR